MYIYERATQTPLNIKYLTQKILEWIISWNF